MSRRMVCVALVVAACLGCNRPVTFDEPAPGAVRLFVEQTQEFRNSDHWFTEDIVRELRQREACADARVHPVGSTDGVHFRARFEGHSFTLSDERGNVTLTNQTWRLHNAVDDICEAIAAAGSAP